MKSEKLLLLTFGLAVAAAFAVAALPLAAQQSPQLTGTYSSTGDSSCLTSSTGFNPNLTPAAGAVVYLLTGDFQGTLKFDTDGTGTGEVSEVYLQFPPAPVSGGSLNHSSFPFTYTVADDGVLTLNTGLVSGTFTAGPFTGFTFSITPPPLSGRVARNGTITLTSTVPTPETLTIHFPPPPSGPGDINVTRICYRTRVLIPLVDENN